MPRRRRPGHGGPLPHSAGQPGRHELLEARESDCGEQRARTRLARGAVSKQATSPASMTLPRALPWQEGSILEHDADRAFHAGALWRFSSTWTSPTVVGRGGLRQPQVVRKGWPEGRSRHTARDAEAHLVDRLKCATLMIRKALADPSKLQGRARLLGDPRPAARWHATEPAPADPAGILPERAA